MKGKIYHIGRNKNSNEIFVFNETVSSSHAQVILDATGDLIIIDLSSTNGVRINGDKIQSPVKLFTNDIITIGNFSCTRTDIINAIKVFDFKNKKPEIKSIKLNSSVEKLKKKKNVNKINFRTVFTALIVILSVAFILGSTLLSEQNSVKNILKPEKIENKNEINPSKKIFKTKKQRTDVNYNFSCLKSTDDKRSNEVIFKFGEFTRNTQKSILNDIEITIEEEKQAGDDMIKELQKKYTFKNGGSVYLKLNRIMNDLIKRLAKPRGIDYEMHFIDDTIMNVFTLGGHIVVFSGMYDFCETDSEIASIISHEISHNELGHSTLALKKQKVAQGFGIFGQIALAMENIVTTSFNQKQETEADLFGMDIMFPTSYDNCDAIELWNRMGQDEHKFSLPDNFLRSHPYSSSRANCVDYHLSSNYNKQCP
jgi:pSer/pThr/pTyr-binding forkhead associated (FHA) protein